MTPGVNEAPGPPSGTEHAQARYFERLAEGIFQIPRCTDCGRPHFYPRICCPHCGSLALEWFLPSGRGVVYATTVVRRIEGDHTVCLVDLDEGPRLMSRVVELPVEQVCIGLRVQARIDITPEGPLLVFVPGEAS